MGLWVLAARADELTGKYCTARTFHIGALLPRYYALPVLQVDAAIRARLWLGCEWGRHSNQSSARG